MLRIARVGLSLILALLAVGCAVVAIGIPELQRADQLEQIAKLRLFERAARYTHAYHRRTGKYPTEEKVVASLGAGSSIPNIGVDGEKDGVWRVGCHQEQDFQPAPSDGFVLSAWNGNGFDCFASPSGTHNLRTAKGGWWFKVLTRAAVGLLLAFSAWAVWPGRNPGKRLLAAL